MCDSVSGVPVQLEYCEIGTCIYICARKTTYFARKTMYFVRKFDIIDGNNSLFLYLFYMPFYILNIRSYIINRSFYIVSTQY